MLTEQRTVAVTNNNSWDKPRGLSIILNGRALWLPLPLIKVSGEPDCGSHQKATLA